MLKLSTVLTTALLGGAAAGAWLWLKWNLPTPAVDGAWATLLLWWLALLVLSGGTPLVLYAVRTLGRLANDDLPINEP